MGTSEEHIWEHLLREKTTINGGVNFYIWKSHTAQTRETDCI
jgi:hypothetical protein